MSTLTNFTAKIHRFFYPVLFGAALLFTTSSCTGLQQASTEKPLLVKNDIRINGRPTLSDEDYDIMRQRPNKGLGNIRLFVSLYGLGSKLGENATGNWLKRIGEPPAFFDPTAFNATASQLKQHYFNLGFYQASDTAFTEQKGKKIIAHYHITTGPQHSISEYSLRSTSRFIDSALAHYPKGLESTDALDAERIEEEQLTLTNFLKNHGYYTAQLGWVYFEIDTTAGPHASVITGVVDPFIFGGRDERQRISKITVRPTYSFQLSNNVNDSTRTVHGIDVLQNNRRFRPGFIDEQIYLERGAYYDQNLLRSTYRNLNSLGVFQTVEFNVQPKDNALHATLNLVPLPKRSVSANLEGLGNSGSLGVGGSFNWDNRNLFKGGETLRLSLGGALTEQRNSTNTSWLIDARELNAGVALQIPKLLLPQSLTPRQAKFWQPKTQLGAQLAYQYRAQEFNRFNFSTNLEYSWTKAGTKHFINPVQLSFVSINFANDTALAPFLFVGFQNIIFATTSYQYQKTWKNDQWRYFLNASAKTGGHLARIIGLDEWNGNPIAQFAKTSLDFRAYRSLVRKRQLASRTFLGVSQSWNSSSGFVPFEQSFFMGGANDMRGWTAYHFGPGATSEDLLQRSGFFAAAPIKLVQSLEYRFTIQSAMKGAVFLDLGNMWLYDKTYAGTFTGEQEAAIEAGKFGWNSFYKQLGMNTGYGLRYDLEFFIIRADVGLKLHHPGAVDRSNWVITAPQLRDFNLALGIGYPF
ncbi:MAG: BamA/TamA family outer membrane protein [Bacteroidetes bacterium]|nr:BamA/TamA family outer membrane protein [Bacteroidota bacterium]